MGIKLIEFPIFSHSNDTQKSKELGLNYTLSECEIKSLFFNPLQIVGIAEYIEDEKEYTEIITHGESYMSPLTLLETAKILSSYES